MFLRRVDLRTAVLAVVALLIAQLGAMTHAYSHDLATSTTQRTLAAHDPCKDCFAYAPLLSAVPGPSPLPSPEFQTGRSAQTRLGVSLIEPSLGLAFRSRAPPLNA